MYIKFFLFIIVFFKCASFSKQLECSLSGFLVSILNKKSIQKRIIRLNQDDVKEKKMRVCYVPMSFQFGVQYFSLNLCFLLIKSKVHLGLFQCTSTHPPKKNTRTHTHNYANTNRNFASLCKNAAVLYTPHAHLDFKWLVAIPSCLSHVLFSL